MNYVLIGTVIFITAILLSLKSMREFLNEIHTPNAKPQTAVENKGDAPHEHSPIILDENPMLEQSLFGYLNTIKANPESDLVIEKIHLNNTFQFVIYPPGTRSIWSNHKPEGYIVTENQSPRRPDTLAEQFIIRHKYNDVFYCSYRSLERKPTTYIESGVDEVLWDQFYLRQHTQNPTITLSPRIVSHMLNHEEKDLRRTSV